MRFRLLLLICMLSSALLAIAECLPYEPMQVSLCGKIVELTYPGRPNFESIKDGDEAETYWYLFLHDPTCVKGKAGDDLDVDESNIQEIQLILDAKQYKQYRSLIGKKACVSGALSHEISGHHHRTILMVVKEIKAVA